MLTSSIEIKGPLSDAAIVKFEHNRRYWNVFEPTLKYIYHVCFFLIIYIYIYIKYTYFLAVTYLEF